MKEAKKNYTFSISISEMDKFKENNPIINMSAFINQCIKNHNSKK